KRAPSYPTLSRAGNPPAIAIVAHFCAFPGPDGAGGYDAHSLLFAAFASLPFVSLQPTCGPAASTCDTPSPGASPNAETRLQLRRKRRPMNRGVASMAAALLA